MVLTVSADPPPARPVASLADFRRAYWRLGRAGARFQRATRPPHTGRDVRRAFYAALRAAWVARDLADRLSPADRQYVEARIGPLEEVLTRWLGDDQTRQVLTACSPSRTTAPS